MKKLLFIAVAAIVFAGCQKEMKSEDTGLAAVVVKIEDGGYTRAMTGDKTTATAITWENANVTLTATTGGKTESVAKNSLTSGYVIKDIVSPTKLEVSIHGGAAQYTSLSPFKTVAAAAMPNYGATTTFAPQSEGYVDGGKTYQKLTATVTTKIPVARLEVGGITFNTAGTKFQAITLADVYVDGAPVKEVEINYATEGYGLATNVEHKSSHAKFLEYDTDGCLNVDVVSGDTFLTGGTSTATFPASGVYAFNVFGQETNLPTLKLHFTDCTLKKGTCASEQYAFIKEYKTSAPGAQTITKFEPGKIYQIESLTVADANLSPDPNSGIAYALVATVTVAEWEIVGTTGTLN